jgi:hypothetical protein
MLLTLMPGALFGRLWHHGFAAQRWCARRCRQLSRRQ